MIEQDIVIAMPDGEVDAVIFHEPGGPARPGVVHITDIGGIRDATRGMARRVASAGYTVLQPNIFHRTGRPPVIGYPLDFNDPRTRQRFGELTTPLTPDAIEADAAAYVDHLAGLDTVLPGPMGVVGYCFGGGFALRVAARRPDRIAAAASFHGARLFTDQPDSPHLVLSRVTAELYFGHAENDRSMPAEAIAGLERALEAWRGVSTSEVYRGARHGWTVPDSAAYDAPQAERAFSALTALLARALR